MQKKIKNQINFAWNSNTTLTNKNLSIHTHSIFNNLLQNPHTHSIRTPPLRAQNASAPSLSTVYIQSISLSLFHPQHPSARARARNCACARSCGGGCCPGKRRTSPPDRRRRFASLRSRSPQSVSPGCCCCGGGNSRAIATVSLSIKTVHTYIYIYI